ncbi:hypothetical protein BaRGS_00007788 [Batillaria attramentaria]|uniref:Uncharacterized protein n=1 Tax=Batillaria attramentaria TaxID=370345 RepID=A0ABD0LNV7_9CAEN
MAKAEVSEYPPFSKQSEQVNVMIIFEFNHLRSIYISIKAREERTQRTGSGYFRPNGKPRAEHGASALKQKIFGNFHTPVVLEPIANHHTLYGFIIIVFFLLRASALVGGRKFADKRCLLHTLQFPDIELHFHIKPNRESF